MTNREKYGETLALYEHILDATERGLLRENESERILAVLARESDRHWFNHEDDEQRKHDLKVGA